MFGRCFRIITNTIHVYSITYIGLMYKFWIDVLTITSPMCVNELVWEKVCLHDHPGKKLGLHILSMTDRSFHTGKKVNSVVYGYDAWHCFHSSSFDVKLKFLFQINMHAHQVHSYTVWRGGLIMFSNRKRKAILASCADNIPWSLCRYGWIFHFSFLTPVTPWKLCLVFFWGGGMRL